MSNQANCDYLVTCFNYETSSIGAKCKKCTKCQKGFQPHAWRKLCAECKCDKYDHELVLEYSSRSRLSIGKADSIDAKSLGYCWVPSGLSVKQIDIFFSQLSVLDVPRIGSSGERNRNKRILLQLPKQDLSLQSCKHIERDNEIVFENFVKARNKVALNVGQVTSVRYERNCLFCRKTIATNTFAVTLSHPNEESFWHPNCFRCDQCRELLVDLIYCLYKNVITCERHYAEKFKPRCASCDEASKNLITVSEPDNNNNSSSLIIDNMIDGEMYHQPRYSLVVDAKTINDFSAQNQEEENKSRICRNRKRFRRKSSNDLTLSRDVEIQALTELENEEQKKLRTLRKSRDITNELSEGLSKIFNRTVVQKPAILSIKETDDEPFWVNRNPL